MRTAAALGTLAVLLAVEWMWFAGFVRDFVLPGYPENHDQVVYLWRSYYAYFAIETRGVVDALAAHLGRGDPLGSLLDVQAAFAYDLVATDRLGALSVNFAHFAALQIGTYCLLTWLTGSIGFGMIGVALLLSSAFAHYTVGGLFDFRLDFAAACSYGLLVAALVRSRCFGDRRWALASGLAGGYVIGMRHNTFLYVVPLFAVLALTAWTVDRCDGAARDDDAAPEGRGRRFGPHLRGAVGAWGTLAVAAAPFVVFSWSKVFQYYAAQFASRGPARNVLEGRGWLEHYLFYPASLFEQYLGSSAVVAAAALVGVALCFGLRRPGGARVAASPRAPAGLSLWIMGVAIGIPLTLFTLHSARSNVVTRMLVPPVVFIATTLLADVAALAKGAARGSESWRWIAVAGLVLLLGAAAQHQQYEQRMAMERGRLDDATAIFDMHAVVAETLHRLGMTSPAFTVNSLRDSLEPRIASVALFERQEALLLPNTPALQNQIFAAAETFWGAVRLSDVLLLQTSGDKVEYPYVEFVDSVAAELESLAREQFVPIGKWSFAEYSAEAYIAPRMHFEEGVNLSCLDCGDGGAATFVVAVPRLMLQARPVLTLDGAGAAPASLRASVISQGGAPAVDGEAVAVDGGYRVELRLDSAQLGAGELVEIRLELWPHEANTGGEIGPPLRGSFVAAAPGNDARGAAGAG